MWSTAVAHWLWYFATEHEFIGSIPCCGGRIPGQGAEYENARVYLHLTALMSHAFFFSCTIHPQFHSICCITWPCAPAVYSPRFMAEMLLSRCARLHFLADVPVFLLPLDAHRSSGTGVNCSFVMCNAPSLEETPIDKGALARDRANALWN